MKKLFFLLALWLLSQQTSSAQNRRAIDSLQAMLPKAHHDTTLANLHNALSSHYYVYNNDSSLLHAREGLRISEQAGFKKGTGRALANIGGVYVNQDNYPEALKHLHQALAIYREIGLLRGEEQVNFTLGHTYLGMANYPEALNHYLYCLKMSEQRGDARATGRYYFAVASVYGTMGNVAEKRRYTLLSLEFSEKAKDKSMLGSLNSSLADLEFLDKNYENALELAEKALLIAEELGDITDQAYVLTKMGDIWKAMGNDTKALAYYQQSMAICKAKGYKLQEANLYSKIGQIYLERKAYDKAFRNFQDHLTLATEINGPVSISQANEDLHHYYLKRDNFKKALEHYKTYIVFRDSAVNKENASQVLKTQMQFDFDKKEATNKAEQDKKDALAVLEIKRQKTVRNGFIGGFALMLIFAGIFFTQRNNIKKSNAALETAKSRAEASEAFKSRFLANMSHEIRTPLHGIAGFTDLLLDTSLTEKQRRWLLSVQHSTERLTEVVNDILDLSKLQAGEMRLRQVPFSLAQIAADVQEALSLRAENKGIGLHLRIDKNVPVAVVGDPTRLYQILMNLTGNAVKFTEKGSVTLHLSSEAVPSSPHLSKLLFSIADTGIGIPPEQLNSIFGSFRQAGDDTADRFGGTGLGLTIAHELVQLHGSDIRVESVPGKGSTFSFALALPTADAAELTAKTAVADDLYFKQPLRILLADDHAFNREIATEALLRHFENVDIVEAENGKVALELLANIPHPSSHIPPFDLLLMDVQMPEMSGTEATKHIRLHFPEGKKDVPIIALTASATPEEIEKALESGMNRHLAKPFKPTELAKAVAETLGLATGQGIPSSKKPESRNVPPASTANFDLRFLRDFCENDEAQVQHFLQKFMAQCPLEIERLEAAFEKQDLEAIYQTVHSFKPQLEFVGLTKAASLAQALEQAATAQVPMEQLSDLLAAIKMELQHAG